GALFLVFFFFQAEDGIRDFHVTGVQTCALPISFTDPNPKPSFGLASTKLEPIALSSVIGMDPFTTTWRKFPKNEEMDTPGTPTRSEERRVGKESRYRWSPERQKKKT